MVGDQILGALHDPAEVAHAQLTAAPQGERERQPGRVAEGVVGPGQEFGGVLGRALGAQPRALGGIDVQELPVFHSDILTDVGMSPPEPAESPDRGRYGVGMYPSTWTTSDEFQRLIVAPLAELLARSQAISEPPAAAVLTPRSAPRNMLDPKQAGI